MAGILGATSLAEVHQERLDQLLNDLADVLPARTGQLSPRLGVPAIDALLDVFMQRLADMSIDTGQQTPQTFPIAPQEQILKDDGEMPSRCEGEDETTSLRELPRQVDRRPSSVFFGSATRNKRPPPVVEISSSVSGSGKTQLLYYMTARAILPRNYGSIEIGGLESAVVWMDADDRFDVYRLRDVAQGIIRKAQGLADDELSKGDVGISDAELTGLLTSSFQHVHIFRPQSSPALLATLGSLDKYLYDLSRHHSFSRSLHMLVIDSATAFLWQDRLRDEVARTEEIGRSRLEVDQAREQKQSFYLSDLYMEMVMELRRLQACFGCTVVYTTTVSSGHLPASKASARSGPPGPYDHLPLQTPSLRPALPAPWGKFPILRLVVHRDTVRPFPPAMSAHDASRDASMRQSVVRQGKFSAWVNAWGREDWPCRVVDGVNWYNGGCFSFYVRAAGVEIPLPDH